MITGKRTLKFILEIEITVDGEASDHLIDERLIDALNDGMPSVFFDDDEIDCMAWVDSWGYELNHPLNIGKCQNCGHEHEAPMDKTEAD